jgi:ribonuclease E
MAIEVVRTLLLASQHQGAYRITITVADEVATYLNNRKRRELSRIEDEAEVSVQVLAAKGVSPEFMQVDCEDAQGREIKLSFA